MELNIALQTKYEAMQVIVPSVPERMKELLTLKEAGANQQ